MAAALRSSHLVKLFPFGNNKIAERKVLVNPRTLDLSKPLGYFSKTVKREIKRPLETPLTNPTVEHLLFGKHEDGYLRRMGFRPRDVDNWSVAIFKGKTPKGFESLDEFENHVLSMIEIYYASIR